MQTDSSASRTCIAVASAVEWTATVLMPMSRQARWSLSAIAPRLAIRTFSNIKPDEGHAALTLIAGSAVSAARRIRSAPFSAIMIVGALVLVEVTVGITEAS